MTATTRDPIPRACRCVCDLSDLALTNQAITEVTEDDESIRRRRTSSRATSTAAGHAHREAPLPMPGLLVTTPSATSDSRASYGTAEERLGYSGSSAQPSPSLLASPQLGDAQRQSVADTFGRPYSNVPSPLLRDRASQETF